nr:hypothetical protein [Tanacetum cinerariifolium]
MSLTDINASLTEHNLHQQYLVFSSSSKDSPGDRFKPSREEEKKDDNDPGNKDNEASSTEEPRVNQEKDSVNNTNKVNAVSSTVNTASYDVNAVGRKSSTKLPDDLNMPKLEDINIFEDSNEDDDSRADINNLDTNLQVFRNKKDERGIMIRNKARLVAQGHTQEEGIDYDEVFALIARIEAIWLFLAFASFMGFMVYQMEVKSAFLYGTVEEEVYVCQPLGFKDPDYSDKMNVKSAFLYRKIEEEVYACQYLGIEDPDFLEKVYKVEKALYELDQSPRGWVFRYLKGQPKLGLWYHKDLPFNLEAYTDNDYAGASLDMKSTTGANPTVYTLCIEQFWATAKTKNINGEAQIHTNVDEKKVIIFEATIRRDLKFEDESGVDCLSNEVIFEQLTLIGTMASAIICLATNQKFNFSKYIFESLVKNLDTGNRFLMYPRFVQVFLDKQVDGMSKHNAIYVVSSYTKKVGLSAKVKSSTEEQSLGEEDASKLERNIADIDADAEITLVDEIAEDKGRFDDQEMFDTNITIDGIEETVSTIALITTVDVTPDELTMAQALVEIKKSKPKGDKDVIEQEPEQGATKTTITVTIPKPASPRLKARGVVRKEPSETPTTTIIPISSKV